MSSIFASSDHTVDVAISIATIAISVFASWITAKLTIKSDDRRAIREGNIRLLEWAMEYPFLESDKFCSSWPDTGKSEDDNSRYENYCCHVFNQIHHAWELHGSDERKMRPTLYPEELVARHRIWWETDEINQKAYEVEFQQFIASIFRRLDQEKKDGPKSNPH